MNAALNLFKLSPFMHNIEKMTKHIFNNLAVFTPQVFSSTFGHFLALIHEGNQLSRPVSFRSLSNIHALLIFTRSIFRDRRQISLLIFSQFERNQSAFTCSKLTIETLDQGVKYVQR